MAVVNAILFFLITWQSCVCKGCELDDVAVYRVVLKTFWSEELFPKDYPKVWPKAQWSQLFGQSHNSSYSLYHLGEVAKPTVQNFSQTGHPGQLVTEGDDDGSVYDQFSAPALSRGVGETENMVLVNGEHSLVSAICKIIPSPDWFIGVDSVNLCVDSSWVEQLTLDLEPLDSGAASGLTFTAPRWETNPPELIAKHGPKSPNHPAAGFYYPDLKELPAIGTIEFIKIKEYSSKELNEIAKQEIMKSIKLNGISKKELKNLVLEYVNDTEEPTTKTSIENLEDFENAPKGTTPRLDNPDDYVEVITKKIRTSTTTTTEAEFDPQFRNMDEVVLAVANGRKLGLGKHLPRHFRSRLHHAVNRITPNDCLVSEWGEWSPCSKTCGFGDKFRSRHIVRHPTLDGRECPKLKERAHCGNANSCFDDLDYFKW